MGMVSSGSIHLALVVAAASVVINCQAPDEVPRQGSATQASMLNFDYSKDFGDNTFITINSNGIVDGSYHYYTAEDKQLNYVAGHRLVLSGDSLPPTNESHGYATARASAWTGKLGSFIRTDWSGFGTGRDAGSSGYTYASSFDRCTLVADDLAPGTPVPTALAWELRGSFTQMTPGTNSFVASLSVNAIDSFSRQIAQNVVIVSSETSLAHRQGQLALPGVTVGATIRLEPYFQGFGGGPAFRVEWGSFIGDWEATVVPVVTERDINAHWICAGMSQSVLDATQWQVTHCPPADQGPQQQLAVAYIPITYSDSLPSLTFDEVEDRAEYTSRYYYQQSMCSTWINPIMIRNPAEPDGWWRTNQPEAWFVAIPPDGANDFRRTATIWNEAFLAASANDPAFLVNQQLHAFDAIVVIAKQDKARLFIRPRAYITRSMASQVPLLEVASTFIIPLLDIAGVPLVPELEQLVLGPLSATMFAQGSVITNDEEGAVNYAHELGHALFTLWDLYASAEPFVRGDVRGANGDDWDLMGRDGNVPPPPVSTYHRALAGWQQPFWPFISSPLGEHALTALQDTAYGSPILRFPSPRGPTDWFIAELRDGGDGVVRPDDQPHIVGTWDAVISLGGNRYKLIDDAPNARPFAKHRLSAPGQRIAFDGFDAGTNAQIKIIDSDESSVTVQLPPDVTWTGLDYETWPASMAGDGAKGVVLYQERNLDLLRSRTPFCGGIHGGAQHTLHALLGYQFGSCLSKLNNAIQFPANPLAHPTLLPGQSLVDDQAGLEFSLATDFVLTVQPSASTKSRTMVSLEVTDIAGAEPLGGNIVFPDLHVTATSGDHVGRRMTGTGYDVDIAGARIGGAESYTQWISFPDDQQASWFVDAAPSLDVAVRVSITHFDADGVASDLQPPVDVHLTLAAPTTAPAALPPLP